MSMGRSETSGFKLHLDRHSFLHSRHIAVLVMRLFATYA